MHDIILTGLVGFSLISSGFLLGKNFWICQGVTNAVKILAEKGYIQLDLDDNIVRKSGDIKD